MNLVNQMHKIRNLLNFFMFMVAAAILFLAGSVSAVEKPLQSEDALLGTYHSNMSIFEINNFGFPLFMESFERGDRVHVDVYGIFDQPSAALSMYLMFRRTGAISYLSIPMSRRARTGNCPELGS